MSDTPTPATPDVDALAREHASGRPPSFWAMLSRSDLEDAFRAGFEAAVRRATDLTDAEHDRVWHEYKRGTDPKMRANPYYEGWADGVERLGQLITALVPADPAAGREGP